MRGFIPSEIANPSCTACNGTGRLLVLDPLSSAAAPSYVETGDLCMCVDRAVRRNTRKAYRNGLKLVRDADRLLNAPARGFGIQTGG